MNLLGWFCRALALWSLPNKTGIKYFMTVGGFLLIAVTRLTQ
jgi:hypothetical protein